MSAMVAIVAEAFLSRLAFGIMAFVIPLHAHAMGMSLPAIAFLVTLNTAVALVLKVVAGHFTDWIGLKRGALLGITGRSVVTLLFAVAGAGWHLFALQAGRGVAKAVRDPSMAALVAENGGKGAVATAFAWYKTATSAAGALGKALAGVLLSLTAFNFPIVYLFAFALSVLPVLAVVRFVPASPKRFAAPSPDPEPAATPSLVRPRLLAIMGLGFLVSTTAQMLRSLLPILAIEHAGLSAAQTGMLFLVATCVTLLAGPLFGWLADTVSRDFVLAVRGAANILSSALYLIFPTFAGFLAGKAVDEAGKAAFNPAWGSLMAETAARDPPSRGRTMGLLDASEDAGAIAGPMVAALLWSTGGVGVLLVGRIILAVVTELYAFVLLTRSRTIERPT